MIVTLKNNTDYPNGIKFTETDELKQFVQQYYRGEEGNAYWETWRVDGDYPDELLDILSPPDTGNGWQRA